MKKATFIELAAWIGAAIVASDYVLFAVRFYDKGGGYHSPTVYHCLNLLGSLIMIPVAFIKKARQALLLNIFWAVAATIGICIAVTGVKH